MKKLYRTRHNAVIGGVCAGVAEYFDLEVSNIRWAAVILGLFNIGILAYIIMWIVLPVKE